MKNSELIKTFNAVPLAAQVEKWETQNGTSVRVVKRKAGRFVDNKSARQLLQAQA